MAKSPHGGSTRLPAAKLLGTVRRGRAGLMVTTALQAAFVVVLAVPATTPARAQPAPDARPVGGQVVGGSASISQAPTVTTVTQSSQRAAVNWRSFDVGAQQTVQFDQPSASAATLNRVTGPNPSQIAGRIDANGQVILVNQDGVTFYKGAQVNASGLVVSAAGISNQNFMAGHMVFDQPAQPNARVVNRGNITVKQAGLAALVAPQVANSGVITAKLGHVVLAGASAATLDLYGDGLVSIDVTKQVEQVPVGPGGKTATALVTNSGTVLADGGTVQLTAQAVDGVVQTLINAGGKIQANSVGSRTGAIALEGVGGSITVAGQLTAEGVAAGTSGGQIKVLADEGVMVASTARLNASGRAGGGVVAVGATLRRAKGGPSVTGARIASTVTVEAGASIAADATGNGTGGRVAVLSSGDTEMDGMISAKGGPQGGDGGFVEVSGQTLGFSGSVNVGAAAGNLGTILFDPATLDIINGGSGAGGLDTTLTATGTILATEGGITGTVSNGAIDGLTGNVVLQATTLLDVQASLNVPQGLTMQSGGDLVVGPGLSIQAGTTLLLGSGIVFPAGTVGAAGAISLGAGDSLIAPLIILQGGSTGIALNNALLSASSSLDISTAGGGVTELNTGTISTGTLTSSGGIVGTASLMAAGNSIGVLGAITVANGNFDLEDASPLTVNEGILATDGNILLHEGAGSALTINGSLIAASTVAASTGTISLVTDSLVVGGDAVIAGQPDFGQPAALVEIAPSSTAVAVSLGGGSTGLVLGAALFEPIFTQTLRIGAFTDTSGAVNVTAPSISFAGTFDLASEETATTLDLETRGSINQLAGNVLSVGTLTGTAGGAVSLLAMNLIDTIATLSAGGSIAVIAAPPPPVSTDPTTLTLTGKETGSTLFFENPTAGGTIALDAATLVATGTAPLVSLVADNLTQPAASTIAATATGVVQLAPFSTIAVTLGGTADTLLSPVESAITPKTGTLAIGGYTGTDGFGTITAQSITIAEALNLGTVAGTLSLLSSGIIIQDSTAPITVGTLAGTASTLFLVQSPNNSISSLGAITVNTGAFELGDSIDLTINGAIDANQINLNTTGGITETSTGLLETALLSGSAQGDVLLTNPANMISTSAGLVSSNGDVVLVDGENLTLTGAQSGNNLFFEVAAKGGTLTLADAFLDDNDEPTPATLTAAPAGRISLVTDNYLVEANPVTGVIDSTITAPAGTLEVAPYPPSMTTVSTSLLQSSSLLSIVNVGTTVLNELVIGGFTDVPSGATSSTPSAAAITVDGTLDLAALATTLDLEAIGGVSQSAPIINVGTLLGTTGSTALTSSDNTVAVLGNYIANNGFSLSDASSLNIAGSVVAGPSASFTVAGSLTETGGLIADALSGSVAANATLTGSNFIATLGNFTAGGGLALSDASSLNIAGSVVAGPSASFTVAGSLTETGGLIAPVLSGSVAGNAGLTGSNSIAALGNFTAGDGLALSDATSLNIAGSVVTGPSASFTVAGSLTETGSLATNLLSGSVAGSAGLTGSNSIPTLGNFTAGGGLALSDAGSLNIAGSVVTGPSASFAVAGALTETGSLTTDMLSGGVAGNAGLTSSNSIATLGNFTAGDGLALSDASSLNIAGSVVTGPSASFTVAGSLTETGGLTAGVLSGSVAANAALMGGNSIATLGNFTAGGGLALSDASSLNIAGSVVTGPSASFTVAGSLTETGSLITDVLSGSAVGSGDLTGNNNVAGLDGFAVSGTAGSFVLNDNGDLLIDGVLDATRIVVSDPSSLVSLGNGATVVTGGNARPSSLIPPPSLLPANGAAGAYLQAGDFSQIGSSTLLGQGGGPPTLQIAATGNMQFDSPLGLQATGGWLILNLANGTAAGNVFISALDVSYTTPGSANLFGTIRGIIGGPAAAAGFIQPAINISYLFNGCEIEAAVCRPPPPPPPIPPTVISLPADALTAPFGGLYEFRFLSGAPPQISGLTSLNLFALPMLASPPGRLTDPDVVPPNISYKDY